MKFTAAKREALPAVEEVLAKLNQDMPHSDEAEVGLLACLFVDPRRIDDCRRTILPDAFYKGDTRLIYTELLAMDETGSPIDADGAGVTRRLRDQGKLEVVGGVAGITAVVTGGGAFFEHHLKSVVDRWRLRRAIYGFALGLRELQSHYADRMSDPVESSINAASQLMQGFTESDAAAGGTTANLIDCLIEHSEHMQALQERMESQDHTLLPTGFPTLDGRAGGIGMNEYWLVTGPTKSGKSVLTGCIARHVATRGFHAKVYTNEIDRKVYAGRLLMQSTDQIPPNVERLGFKNRGQMEAYSKSMRDLQNMIGKRLKLDNASGKYVEDIVADMRNEARAGTHLFIVDLIGKLRTRERFESRERELAHISLSLCDATKRFNVACIAVAQENEDGQVRESRSLSFDCEAWLKVCYVANKAAKKSFGDQPEPTRVHNRRTLVVEMARGFAAGDVIPCYFEGSRFLMGELAPHHDNRHDGIRGAA